MLLFQKKYSLFLFAFLLCLSCNENSKQNSRSKKYFDLAGFIETQQLQLQNQKTFVEKTISKNKITETKIISQVNWENELKVFSDADINKPARENSYTIDSIKTDSSLSVIYSAKELSLPEKKMKIISEKGVVKKIEIENSFDSFYYYSSVQLTYMPSVGYSLIGKRQALFANETLYSIAAKFIFQ